eukprot:TRINITY_DN6265_c0_g1_i1.p1 TRINITY_DN6265_c0_g1~~TRINITY_DN6265_c0_g1_i1.p1  ORF type:complete len:636 (-),score=163.89 TRINITY_DN6265_c0_g1_i1:1-1908(-)
MDAMLFSSSTQALIYNYKESAVQGMLDFDTLCQREVPSVAALIAPGHEGFHKAFFRTSERLLPVFPSITAASHAHPLASVFINFASFRSAYESSLRALEEPNIKVVVIIAEGVPENQARRLIAVSKRLNKTVIGPATVGGIQAGCFKIANTAGTIDNIIQCKLYRPGSVGFVSKSGGLSNEMYSVLSRTTDGIFEGIAIGGDAFPGSTIIDHVRRFERVPQVKMIVLLGEIGGWEEYEIAKALQSGEIKKPVCAWVSGTVAKIFPTEVQFGHAGAKSGDQAESADAKNRALVEAGAGVPDSFEHFAEVISRTYQGLVASGVIVPRPEPPVPALPVDFRAALKQGKVRKATTITSTICDDRGDEPKYSGVPISEVIRGGFSMGDVIGLLWFKRRLPRFAAQFIEMCLVMVADHGPCVSGAHNTIVASRAGKDLVSSLASGLLTIGPRFGGAIDDAARFFKEAVESKATPVNFVESMKAQGKRIPGIGHLIKSRDNPDQRVVPLKEFAASHFSCCTYLDFALAVEQYTLCKASNLILNVDGCIGVLFLDLLHSVGRKKSSSKPSTNGKSSSEEEEGDYEGLSDPFSEAQIQEIVDIGYLNGLFVLGRSIGLIGHSLDQKRMKQPLYRHPWEDVLYDM